MKATAKSIERGDHFVKCPACSGNLYLLAYGRMYTFSCPNCDTTVVTPGDHHYYDHTTASPAN